MIPLCHCCTWQIDELHDCYLLNQQMREGRFTLAILSSFTKCYSLVLLSIYLLKVHLPPPLHSPPLSLSLPLPSLPLPPPPSFAFNQLMSGLLLSCYLLQLPPNSLLPPYYSNVLNYLLCVFLGLPILCCVGFRKRLSSFITNILFCFLIVWPIRCQFLFLTSWFAGILVLTISSALVTLSYQFSLSVLQKHQLVNVFYIWPWELWQRTH